MTKSPNGCSYPNNCGYGPLGCDNLLCKLASEKAVKKTVADQMRKNPDILLMRRFAAAKAHISRKDAIAAAQWMLAYAKDKKNNYRRANTPRTR